jgi:hypothetical protein
MMYLYKVTDYDIYKKFVSCIKNIDDNAVYNADRSKIRLQGPLRTESFQ